MKALVLANGVLPSKARLFPALREADRVVCADGAANQLVALGKIPDFVVGDFDSLEGTTRDRLPAEALVPAPSQEHTDLEKALDFTRELGAEQVEAAGITGGRLDHQVNNLRILQRYAKLRALTFFDDTGRGFFVRDTFRLETIPGQQISLIALGRASGVTASGLKFPVKDLTFSWTGKSGQSNEALGGEVRIGVKKGTLLVFAVWPA